MAASSESTQAEGALISPAAAELLAKLLVLVAALLPVTAVAIRMIGFLLDPYLRNVLQLAVALPIIDLTALGAWTLFAPATFLFFFVFLLGALVRVENRIRGSDSEATEFALAFRNLGTDIASLRARWAQMRPALHDASGAAVLDDFATEIAALGMQEHKLNLRFQTWETLRDRAVPAWIHRSGQALAPVSRWTERLPRPVRLAAGLTALAALAALQPAFLMALVLIPTTGLGQILLIRSIRAAGDFQLKHAWPGLAVFMAGYVLASGLLYSGPLPATYHFTTTAGVQDGSYAELGRTDQIIYLRTCADLREGSIAVPVAAIRLIEMPPPTSRSVKPSLVEILQGSGTLKLGAASQCDRP